MVSTLVLQSSDTVNMNTTTIPSSFVILITEKLHKSNYLLWQAQIMPAIRAAQLEGFLDGSVKKPSKIISKTVGASVLNEPNPAYAQWVAKDEVVLGYLLMSLTHEVFTGVATLTTSVKVRSTLASMYASCTHARSVQTRIALATFKKGTQSMVEYYSKMCGYADELATSGHSLGDEEFVSYLLASLDDDFDSVVSAMVVRCYHHNLAKPEGGP
jgi:hypothetical protein